MHILPAFGAGGPVRSLLAFVKGTRATQPELRHTVATLQAGDYMPLLFELKRHGATVLRAPTRDAILAGIAKADVVMLHFWNTPRVWRFLTDDLPSARWVIWSKILGAYAPQRLNVPYLAGLGDIVLTAPPPADLPALADAPVVPGLVDAGRISALERKPHDGFNVDYVGTTNRGKMHPRFIEMMARLDIADLRVRIAGGALEPAMAAVLAAAPDPGRFACLGFVENIAALLATSDVFAYPLAERTYATSDKSLQEAMLAGVPPVILPHGGPSRFVVDGETGMVAQNEDEFVAAIEYLHRNPDRREALGRQARHAAETLFSPEAHVARLMQVVDRAAGQPKRARLAGNGELAPAAALFLMSQGSDEEAASAAVTEWQAGLRAPMERYAEALDDDGFQVEGGILHWRNEAPDDALLRRWTGLWLLRQGRDAEAAQELAEAERLGAPSPGRS